MQEFLRSIAAAFARNRRGLPAFEMAILALLAVAVALQLAALASRWRARRSQLRRFAARNGVSEEDLALVARLARRASVTPLSLLTHLDLFERATAEALAERGASDREDPAPRIRRLRRSLGFDRLPAHTPLLTTRELAPGTAVEVAGQQGQTFDLDEVSFSVEVAAAPALVPGQVVPIPLVHAREARYVLRCRVLSAHPGVGGRCCLVFAHDETPARIQLREYVRAPVTGAVALRPLGPRLVRSGAPPVEVRGELVDVSGGGLLLETQPRLQVGSLVSASFAVAGRPFASLRAVVLSVDPVAAERYRAHLEFRGIAERDRDLLVSAVAQLQLIERAAARAGT